MKIRQKPPAIIKVSHAVEQDAVRRYVELLKSGKVSPPILPKRNPLIEARKLRTFASALSEAGLTAEQCKKITGKNLLPMGEIHKIAKNFDSARSAEFRKKYHMDLWHNPNIENFFQSIMQLSAKKWRIKKQN